MFLFLTKRRGASEREKHSTLNCFEVVFNIGIKSQVIKLVIFEKRFSASYTGTLHCGIMCTYKLFVISKFISECPLENKFEKHEIELAIKS